MCWGCALVSQRWDSAGSRPEPGKHEQRMRPMPELGWAQRLCSLPVFPDGSGCAKWKANPHPATSFALTNGLRHCSCHLLRFSEGFPWGSKGHCSLCPEPSPGSRLSPALLPPGHLRGMGLWPLPFNTESRATTTTKSPAAANSISAPFRTVWPARLWECRYFRISLKNKPKQAPFGA